MRLRAFRWNGKGGKACPEKDAVLPREAGGGNARGGKGGLGHRYIGSKRNTEECRGA